MGGETEERLREQGLAFFGAIAAGFSHEINNVIATINELSGLLDDLARAAEGGRPIEPERLQAIAGKTADQVRRGSDLIKRFNRFAHSADAPVATVRVNDLLENFVAVTARFATLKGVELRTAPAAEPVTVETDPFALEHAIYLVVSEYLAVATPGDRVTLAAEERDGGVAIRITGPGAGTEAPDGRDLLADLVLRLNGVLETTPTPTPGGRDVILVVPQGAIRSNGS